MTFSDKSDKTFLKILRKQLEFYFSEGNLPHDKFMQDCIAFSAHKSVLISDLLKFNKLIELGASEETILRAVSKSKVVTVDEEGSGIKRHTELPQLKPAESRTLYVCGYPIKDSVTEVCEYLKSVFSEHGDVVRVDVPKYPSSKSLKGFAFVEFLTKTAARSALSVYKPAEKDARKAASWKHFSYSSSQYNHSLKQMEMLGHPQKIFFEEFLGEQRKLKSQDKLITVSKKEWCQFKTQFYDAQKSHLSEMKTLINTYQNQQSSDNQYSHKLHERVKSLEQQEQHQQNIITPVVTPLSNSTISGSIVEFQCHEGSEGYTKKTVKTAIATVSPSSLTEIAYIDFRDFSLSGFLRFKSSETAALFIGNNNNSCDNEGFKSVTILSPVQESEYVERISQDKETKRESQKRKNQKKKNKILISDVDSKKIKIEK